MNDIFKKLKGKNSIKKHFEIAKKVCEDFKKYKEVKGIVILGGIARGYSDKYSDIDIIIFTEKKNKRIKEKVKKSWEEYKNKGIEIDISTSSLLEEENRIWDSDAKFAYESGKIIYYDPENKIKKFLKKKIYYSKRKIIENIAEAMIQCDWLITLSDVWVYRGDIVSAHYSINSAIEHLMKAIYAINNEFLPPEKWRIYLLKKFRIIDKNFLKGLKEVLKIKEFTIKELKRRKKIAKKLFEYILPFAENKVGLKFEKFYKYI